MPDSLVLFRDYNDTTGLDLSSYVDVAAGGINPGDAAVRAAQWGGGGSAYGQALLGVTLANREVNVNLLLTAATRSGIHDLQVLIEKQLQGECPVLQWQPEGANLPTFFPVLYGRVLGAERYDYFRERVLYAKRLLVLNCAPYGEGVKRGAAYNSTSAPVVWWGTGPGWASSNFGPIAPSAAAVFPMPSVGGDAPAAVRIHMGYHPSQGGVPNTSYAQWRQIAWGLTPQASFQPFGFAAGTPTTLYYQGTTAGPTLATASTEAIGGQYLMAMGTYYPTAITRYQIGPITTPTLLNGQAQPIPGLYRVVAVVRCFSNVAGWGAVQLSEGGGWVSPVATFTGNGTYWECLDMGDMPVESTLSWSVGFRSGTGASFTASPAFHIAAIGLIPKSWGWGMVDNRNSAIVSQQTNVDGLEPDRGVGILSGGLPATSSIALYPMASQGGFNTRGWLYQGDAPRYLPPASLASHNPGSHMQMVVVPLGPVGAGVGIDNRERVIGAVAVTPRFTFAR